MSSAARADPLDDPAALLAQATARLLASPAWTMTAHPEVFFLEAAARPGLQWYRMEAIFGGDQYAVLIRDGFAYLYGLWQAAMLGYQRSTTEIDAVVGDRWLRCDGDSFLRAGSDHSVRQQVDKAIWLSPGSPVSVDRVEATTDGRIAWLAYHDGLAAVLLPDNPDDPDSPDTGSASLVGLGRSPDGSPQAGISYGNEHLNLPDLGIRGVITLEDAMAGFAARRRAKKAPAKPKPRVPPKVDVYPSDDDDGRWLVGSDHVLVSWDVETGLEAEAIVRELLAEQAPELLGELEFDSYPEAFFAAARSEAAARTVAALIQAR
jgi:hypothetical protein